LEILLTNQSTIYLSVFGLPKTLTSVTFGNCFDQTLSLQNFPLLRVLKLGGCYHRVIELEDCPLTLENISCGLQHIDLKSMRKDLLISPTTAH
jgi:hypothetical protein